MIMAGRNIPIIEVKSLTKLFGKFKALDSVSFSVNEGEVHGFLGPNGAGKSTTIRTMLGISKPTSCRLRIFGLDPIRDSPEINSQLSYIPAEAALWPSLTGQQTLDVLAGLRGSRDRRAEVKIIDILSFDPSKKVRTYSTGNFRKLLLVAAFAAPTDLLILDEPTSGLDPLMELAFQELVTDAVAQGKTILLSSHLLPEVERLCSHVTIIKNGLIVESSEMSKMKQITNMIIEMEVSPDIDIDVSQKRLASEIEINIEDIQTIRQPSRLKFAVDREKMPRVLTYLGNQGISNFTCQATSLEELFIRHYEVGER